MKIKIFSILLAGALLSSCQDEMTRKVDLSASVSPLTEDLSFRGDTAVVKAGTDVVFQFKGDPDFISFFSGEPGHVYANIARTSVPVEEINGSNLTFKIKPEYGIIPNTLAIFVANDLDALSGSDFESDTLLLGEALRSGKLIDITEKCNLPSKSAVEVDVKIDIRQLENISTDKELSILFRYKTDQNKQSQPRWTISGLSIDTEFKDGTSGQLKADALAFTAIDFLNKDNDPYAAKGGEGRWDTRKVSEINPIILIASSKVGANMNEDWLVSKPFFINETTPDTGTAIKDISDNLPQFRYTYFKPGTYKVSFVASNGNYEAFSRVVREVNLVVE